MGFDASGKYHPLTREELGGHLSLLQVELDNLLGNGNYTIEYDKLAKRVVVNERPIQDDPLDPQDKANRGAEIAKIEAQLQDCKELFLGK